MKKEWFDQYWNDMEVPQEELNQAIKNGIRSGKRSKRKRKRLKSTTIITSAAASLILASGLFFSPVTEVLAKVPLLNLIYEDITTTVGSELFASNLVTELDEKATDNGVNITITSAYYDNNVLGFTFKVEGDQLSIKNMDKGNSSASGYGYYLFDGEEQNQLSGSGSGLKETDDGFIGAMEFYQPDQSIASDFTLPITFTSILGEKGTWRFDIPIEKRPAEKVMVEGETRTKDGSYSLIMNSITKGKATTILDYKTIRPKGGKDDHINIDVFDDDGNRLSKRNIGKTVSIEEKSGTIQVQEHSLFTSAIDANDDYLMIYPEVSRDEFDTIHAIQDTPFEVESSRFGYKIVVNKVLKQDQQFIIDYYIKNVDSESYKKDIFQNFADQIKLIRSEDVISNGDGQDQYEALKEDSLILGKKGKLINQEKLHFQSRFELDKPEKFTINDYSLMVPFGIFGMNDSIEMKPVKVDLPNH
ncbi:DUF4179 domain-containing protein [Virgibacillus necropolis]|uniref:DUF4179 domain-containing protein n=1 Tax=Virgibacillus necropolis TaxID=163877 RepID=A0A221MCM9_9BACI|nr:DUF4179 domain-containing protein [Virgibacillus necropolis]ASN05403.1 hypothetical protein CFK40_10465 [Virgibacillus necropolis]